MDKNHQMWSDLGMDLDKHDLLCAALPGAFGDVFLTQENRPKGMDYFNMVTADIHGIRPAELIAAQKEGRKVIGTFCVFVPDEVIIAANGIVTGLCGGSQFWVPEGEKVLPANTCPLIKASVTEKRRPTKFFPKMSRCTLCIFHMEKDRRTQQAGIEKFLTLLKLWKTLREIKSILIS